MESTQQSNDKKTEIAILDISSLPELKGKKEEVEKLVSANPYVSINDASSYQKAKQHRTALKTGRTDLQKDQKMINSRINSFKIKVSEMTGELINVITPHEEEQQNEVKRYEAEKEAEKQAKLEKERKRSEALRAQVIGFRDAKRAAIESATFKTIEAIIADILGAEMNLEEFQDDFKATQEFIYDEAKKKQSQLQKEEDFRIERLKQEEERKTLAAERKKMEEERASIEKERMERETREAKKRQEEEAKMAADRKKLDDERKALEAEAEAKRKEALRLLEEDRKAIEAEKKALADAEAKRKADQEAKEKAEREAAEKVELDKRVNEVVALGFEYDGEELFTFGNLTLELWELKRDNYNIADVTNAKESEEKRIEAIKPDKEKLTTYIASLMMLKVPTLSEEKAQDVFQDISDDIANLITKYSSIINEL